MNVVVAVVLVAGLAILVRVMAGRSGFSHNQRIVLSAIALGLFIWEFGFRHDEVQPEGLALAGLAIVIMGASLFYLRRNMKQ